MAAISFYFTYALVWLVTLLPMWVLYRFSDMLFVLIYYIIPYRKKVVYNNLINSFPDKSEKAIKKTAKQFYRHFCDVIFEIGKTIHYSQKDIDQRVEFKNVEVFKKYYQNNQHVIGVIGHYCNWEYFIGFASHIKPYQAMTIYKTLRNPYFDRFMHRLRSKFGLEVVAMENILRRIVHHDKNGQLTATGFISDQAPPWKSIGHWVDFLNQDTPVYGGIERIGRKYKMALIYMKMSKIKRGRYCIEMIELFEDMSKVTEEEIVKVHVEALENSIKEAPQYWLWSHKRWKRQRNKSE